LLRGCISIVSFSEIENVIIARLKNEMTTEEFNKFSLGIMTKAAKGTIAKLTEDLEKRSINTLDNL
jgi:hypothetical protein